MKVALCFSSDSTRSSLGVDSDAVAVDIVCIDGTVVQWTVSIEARDRILKYCHVVMCLNRLVRSRAPACVASPCTAIPSLSTTPVCSHFLTFDLD